MTTAARRLWLYGLLLLLPALAVGGVAFGLLAREQAQLAARERAAGDTRRAALEARARLVAENIGVLAADVQAALMATLREAPVDEPRPFLVAWQAGNPLVRDIFRATAAGRPVWGPSSDAARAWLVSGSPVPARGAPAVQAAVPVGGPSFGLEALSKREQVAQNVSQYQNARQSLQEVAKVRAAPSVSVLDVVAPAAPGVGRAEADFAVPVRASAERSDGPANVGRDGWSTWRGEDGLHVFGWRELPDGTFVGFELALSMIKLRLGEVLPENEAGEIYALQDEAGAVFHSTHVGVLDAPPAFTLPLAEPFASWRVLARLQDAASVGGSGLAPAAALVALLVLSILAAGALLLQQARRSEADAALKTSFVANVTHELKTPLTTIRLYAELLAQGRVREEERRAEYLATIGRETERLGRLVGNVLDFSRLEQGRKRFVLASIDLAAELRRLAGMQAPRMAESGLVLRLDSPDELEFATDAEAVGQILLNLIDNACKYAGTGGELVLRLAGDAAGGVELRVADRGPGVPAAQRELVFEKFHRVDERLTAERGGAGLGLCIARQLARGLGGDLRCAARDGGGAEFILNLPAP